MTITRMVGFGLALCVLVALGGAGIGGWVLGSRFLLDPWVQEQAGDVNGHLETLRLLRRGDVNAAIEQLEARLDDDLVVLVPEGQSLTAQVRDQMFAALRAAKQYRSEHPRTSSRKAVDAMVRNALSRDIPQPVK